MTHTGGRPLTARCRSSNPCAGRSCHRSTARENQVGSVNVRPTPDRPCARWQIELHDQAVEVVVTIVDGHGADDRDPSRRQAMEQGCYDPRSRGLNVLINLCLPLPAGIRQKLQRSWKIERPRTHKGRALRFKPRLNGLLIVRNRRQSTIGFDPQLPRRTRVNNTLRPGGEHLRYFGGVGFLGRSQTTNVDRTVPNDHLLSVPECAAGEKWPLSRRCGINRQDGNRSATDRDVLSSPNRAIASQEPTQPCVQVCGVGEECFCRWCTARLNSKHQVGASTDGGSCDPIRSVGCRPNEPRRDGLTLPVGQLRPTLPLKPVLLIFGSCALDRLNESEQLCRTAERSIRLDVQRHGATTQRRCHFAVK